MKIKTVFQASIAASFVAAFLFNCSNPVDSDDPNVVIIKENLTAVTTWQTGKIYIIKKFDFRVNNTLTIEPGVIVKFHPAEGPDLTLGGAGTIVAAGTAEKPIVFTSYKDDAHGGDNNGDGSATSPARADWGSVNTNACNGSRFAYCSFLYGGDGALEISAGSVTSVEHCVFARNRGDEANICACALDAHTAGPGTVIKSNTFFDNIRPLSVSMAFDIDNSNSFHDPLNSAVINKYNGISVYDKDLKNDLKWEETEVAFVIEDNDLWINGTLTLGNDVGIKFLPHAVLVLDKGPSAIVNHGGTGVFFTSYKDDTRKGDTNGDAAATAPAAKDWGGIYDNTAKTEPFYCVWSNNIFYDGDHSRSRR